MKRFTVLALALSILMTLALTNVASADFEINNLRLSTAPDGPATTAFPKGTTEIYAVFDYVDATGIPIQLKLYDPVGQVLYLETFEYEGSGSESIKITNGGLPFSDGVYLVNMYTAKMAPQGDTTLYPYQSIEWAVGDATIPEPGSGEVIATVVVQEGAAGTGTASLGSTTAPVAIVGLVAVLIVLVLMVGWAIRGFMRSRP